MNRDEFTAAIDPRLRSGDWDEVFQYCGIEESLFADYLPGYRNGTPSLSGVLGHKGALDGFTRLDVAEIIGLSEGENGGRNWIGAFRLKDERYVFVSAGCDYTGWDYQASGQAQFAADLLTLVQLAMGDEDRTRLGFSSDTFAAKVLHEAGENIPDQVIERWPEALREAAQVWADAKQTGQEMPKPWECQ